MPYSHASAVINGAPNQVKLYDQQIDNVNESGALGTGAIIGIAAGGVCILGLCLGGFVYFMHT